MCSCSVFCCCCSHVIYNTFCCKGMRGSFSEWLAKMLSISWIYNIVYVECRCRCIYVNVSLMDSGLWSSFSFECVKFVHTWLTWREMYILISIYQNRLIGEWLVLFGSSLLILCRKERNICKIGHRMEHLKQKSIILSRNDEIWREIAQCICSIGTKNTELSGLR